MAVNSMNDFFKPRVFLRPTKHIGRTVVPDMPVSLEQYKGPYKRRKQRRWRLANPAHTVSDGVFYVHGQTIICHESDAILVAEIFRLSGFEVLY